MEQKTATKAPLRLSKRPAPVSDAQLKKIGTQISLTSNLFPMSIEGASGTGDYHCYQYDIDVEPQIAEDNRALRYQIFNSLREKIEKVIGKFVFSGKSLFTLKKVSEQNQKKMDSVTALEPINVSGVNYTMRIKFTKEFEITEEELKGQTSNVSRKGNKVTQTINIILKQAIRDLKYVEIGKNSKFFDTSKKIEIENTDLIVYKGMQFNTLPTAKNIYLMTDYASRILRKQTALQFLGQINSNSASLIVGESVITQYNNFQTYKIDRLDTTKNPKSTFLWSKTNQQISFAEYYKQRYGKVVKDLNQPLLVSMRKFREPNTNIIKYEENFLIPELCNMTGLTDQQRSDYKLMASLNEHTKLTPAMRFNEAVKSAQLIQNSTKQAGLQIDTKNSRVSAVRLNPPVLTFGQGKTLTPEKGNFDMRQPIADDKFVLNEWALIYSERDRDSLDAFVDTLKKAAKSYNIHVEDPFYFESRNTNPKEWIQTLKDDFKKNGLPSFVVSFAPNIAQTRTLYPELKQFLYKEAGIEHQHVTPKALQKNGMSVASKISLQIASKKGKKLWQTQVPQGLVGKNAMLIGIETSMKRIADGKAMKQVVGVVSSISADFSRYYSEVDVRLDTDSTLPNLSQIVKKSIEAYVGANKKLPDNVIVYRQGLGEGDIQQSLIIEINAIINGFTQYKAGYEPKLAFFQVNKKIGQKFYEQSNDPRKNGYDNPVSGSLIGKEVVGKDFFEFFLCAQNCNTGVCTPTKYTCLSNSTEFSEDTFWQLTYFQCFNYFNWQGPVRVPAPMMYAGKLAKFTSDVLGAKAKNNLVNSVYYL